MNLKNQGFPLFSQLLESFETAFFRLIALMQVCQSTKNASMMAV